MSSNSNSKGNNCSNGNNWSNGNNCSNGNNFSDGNNWSKGNNWSFFNSKVLGSHYSLFCYSLNGIAFRAFNQQGDEEKINALRVKIFSALNGFLPRTTNYQQMLELGWHKGHKDDNKYVEQVFDEDGTNEKAYKSAWATCPKEKVDALVKVIRETDWLDVPAALEVFTKVTGIDVNAKSPSLKGKRVEVTLDGVKYSAVID